MVIVKEFPHIAQEMKDVALERDLRNTQSINEVDCYSATAKLFVLSSKSSCSSI